MSRSLALLFLVLAPLATAGVRYDFTTRIVTPRLSEQVSGQVWAEGSAYRSEVVRQDGSRVVVISTDADRTARILNPLKQSWTNRTRPANALVVSSALFRWPVSDAQLKGKPRVSVARGRTVSVAGVNAVEHRIEVSFDVTSLLDSAKVDGTLRMSVRIWTAEHLPPLPIQSQLRTGYAEVDALLQQRTAGIRGMVLRHDLTVSRVLSGGPAQTEEVSTVVQSLEEVAVDPSLFEVPATYAYGD